MATFEYTLRDVIEEAQAATKWRDGSKFENKYKKTFDAFIKTLSEKKDGSEILELIEVLIDKASDKMLSLANKILTAKKLIDWKNRRDMIDAIFAALMKLGDKTHDDVEEMGANMTGFSEKLMQMLKRNKLLDQYYEKGLQIIIKAFEQEESPILDCAWEFIVETPFAHPMFVPYAHQLLAKTIEYVRDNIDHKYMEGAAKIAWGSLLFILRSLVIGGGGSVKINGISTDHNPQQPKGKADMVVEYQDELLQIFTICWKEEDWRHSNDDLNLSGELLKTILEDYLNMHCSFTEVVAPFMDGVRALADSGDEVMERDAGYIITATAGNMELAGEDKAAGIELYLNGGNPSIITQFPAMYPKCPELFHPRISRFITAWKGADSWLKLSTISLLSEIAKLHPEEFSSSDLAEIVGTLTDDMCVMMTIHCLFTMSAQRARDLAVHDQMIIQAMERKPEMSSHTASILADIAKVCPDKAPGYLQFMVQQSQTLQPLYQAAFLAVMRRFGLQDPELLKPWREYFEEMKENSTTRDMAQSCIDSIDGRSLEAISQEVNDQKEDLQELDVRVTGTEVEVGELGKDVLVVAGRVDVVEEEVDEHGQRLDQVEENVDDMGNKIEEIDRKTLSHAPVWSREVARLMGEASEHDWRLMASRLGYSNDDIRNWATQHDPCLSMLDEWFATHKTREASYAVSKILEEMNRLDAAAKVVQALEDTKNIVEDDEDDDEPFDPPAIFLSYQWGLQEEVKLLKRHLEWAGYSCWMDIGQMGGGDKLYAKLDQGIRAAKVIISCVSEKYAQSPNCNREVNLSVTLGKPIIPLLMERLSWPPPGTMGPIFSEYLFIRFFARPNETVADDDRYWSLAKFQELLMQMRYHQAPDLDLVTGEYDNWWQPPQEVIVIKPKGEKSSTAQQDNKEVSSLTPASPDVFISYQWGKQTQIQALYKALTSRGYTCWLDIMQMGGGDSLYQKIDSGVRGCKVVLTCITAKYSLSANCRREVSLADALKKPIVPLLLEPMTWPPEGPMSMVFTQLLYINFCKPDISVQDHWQVPQFDELIEKIEQHAPLAILPPADDDDEDNQTEDNQMEDNQTEDNQTEDNQTEDNQTEDNQTEEKQSDEEKEAEDKPSDGGREKEAEENASMNPPEVEAVSSGEPLTNNNEDLMQSIENNETNGDKHNNQQWEKQQQQQQQQEQQKNNSPPVVQSQSSCCIIV